MGNRLYNIHLTNLNASLIFNSVVAASTKVASNLHWGRADTSSIGLCFLAPVLLSFKALSHFTFMALDARKPLLNGFTLRVIKELYPLYRTSVSYELESRLDFSDIKNIVGRLEVELLAYEFDSFPFSNGKDLTHFKQCTSNVLHKLANASSEQQFVDILINSILEFQNFSSFDVHSWSDSSAIFHRKDPNLVALGLRNYFPLGDDLIVHDAEVPNMTLMFLCRILIKSVDCTVYSSTFGLTGPSANQGVTFIAETSVSGMLQSIMQETRFAVKFERTNRDQTTMFTGNTVKDTSSTGRRSYSSSSAREPRFWFSKPNSEVLIGCNTLEELGLVIKEFS